MPILHEAAKLGLDNKQYELAKYIICFLNENCIYAYSAKELENLLDKKDLLNLLGAICMKNLCRQYHINGTTYYAGIIGDYENTISNKTMPLVSSMTESFAKIME